MTCVRRVSRNGAAGSAGWNRRNIADGSHGGNARDKAAGTSGGADAAITCAGTKPVEAIIMVAGDNANEPPRLVRWSYSTASTPVRARYLFVAVAFMRRFRREARDGAS